MLNLAGETLDSFAPHRPRLLRVAYRMVGTLSEAEDVVQDSFVRWHQLGPDARAEVRDVLAFLVRMVTRQCLDQLRSARARREEYVGPWLPEPLFAAQATSGGGSDLAHGFDDGLTLTLMLALERLSPLERAAFLLHDVFDVDFAEVASVLDRDAAACRQLAKRAREHVKDARPRFPVAAAQGQDLADAFFAASRSGDLQALERLLAADVVVETDGGGKRPSALKTLNGRAHAVAFFVGIARKLAGSGEARIVARGTVDGLPGYVSIDALGVLQVTALDLEDGAVRGVYITRNPDKLTRLSPEDGSSSR